MVTHLFDKKGGFDINVLANVSQKQKWQNIFLNVKDFGSSISKMIHFQPRVINTKWKRGRLTYSWSTNLFIGVSHKGKELLWCPGQTRWEGKGRAGQRLTCHSPGSLPSGCSFCCVEDLNCYGCGMGFSHTVHSVLLHRLPRACQLDVPSKLARGKGPTCLFSSPLNVLLRSTTVKLLHSVQFSVGNSSKISHLLGAQPLCRAVLMLQCSLD